MHYGQLTLRYRDTSEIVFIFRRSVAIRAKLFVSLHTPILERLKLDRKTWCELVGTFGRRFFHVAGQPTTIDTMIDTTPSRVSQQRYDIPSQTREHSQDANSRPTASV
jgi:hypothetical protein